MRDIVRLNPSGGFEIYDNKKGKYVTASFKEAVAKLFCCEGFCCDGKTYDINDFLSDPENFITNVTNTLDGSNLTITFTLQDGTTIDTTIDLSTLLDDTTITNTTFTIINGELVITDSNGDTVTLPVTDILSGDTDNILTVGADDLITLTCENVKECETLTTISFTGGILTYVDESGTNNTIDLNSLVSVFTDNNDGTYTHSADGVDTIIDTVTTIVTNTDGTATITNTAGESVTVCTDCGVTTVTNNSTTTEVNSVVEDANGNTLTIESVVNTDGTSTLTIDGVDICIPKCITTSVTLLDDVGGSVACTPYQVDLSGNDTGCVDQDGNALASFYSLDLSSVTNALVSIDSGGVATITPTGDCTTAFPIAFDYVVTCADGTTGTATYTAFIDPDLTGEIQVSKEFIDNKVNANGTATFSIGVANLGTGDATGVVVTDILPTGMTYVSDDLSAYDAVTGEWNVGTIVAGGSAVIQITVLVDAPEGFNYIYNVASATSDNAGSDEDGDFLYELKSDLSIEKDVLCEGSPSATIVPICKRELGTIDNLLNYEHWHTNQSASSNPVGEATDFLSVFNLTDSYGLPAHPNTPDDSGLTATASVALDVNTDTTLDDDQTTLFGYVLVPVGTGSNFSLQNYGGGLAWEAVYFGEDPATAILQSEQAQSAAVVQTVNFDVSSLPIYNDGVADYHKLWFKIYLNDGAGSSQIQVRFSTDGGSTYSGINGSSGVQTSSTNIFGEDLCTLDFSGISAACCNDADTISLSITFTDTAGVTFTETITDTLSNIIAFDSTTPYTPTYPTGFILEGSVIESTITDCMSISNTKITTISL